MEKSILEMVGSEKHINPHYDIKTESTEKLYRNKTCLDCKHCNQCYNQRHQGSNKACDDIELVEW